MSVYWVYYWVLAQDVHIIALVQGYRNLHQVTKTTKANEAPEHNALAEALLSYKLCNKVQQGGCRSWVSLPTDTHPPHFPMDTRNWSLKMTLRIDKLLFTVQFWTPLTNAHLSWAGVKQGDRPERGRSLLEPISRKRRITSPTTAWLQRKSAAILRREKTPSSARRFWPFGGRQIRTCTHDQMVCTETNFKGTGVFVCSRQTRLLFKVKSSMFLVDFQSKTTPFKFVAYLSTAMVKKGDA